MLPTRAYENVPRYSPGGPPVRPVADGRSALVIAAAADNVDRFSIADFTRHVVQTTGDAVRMIETIRPRVVAIDWDAKDIDGRQVCAAARKFGQTAVLVALSSPHDAPAALKAGAHAILLKPFATNLAAARIGRLSRELPVAHVGVRGSSATSVYGINRVWPETCCPKCGTHSATSFEFSSYRRMWYACLACDAAWLGPRQE